MTNLPVSIANESNKTIMPIFVSSWWDAAKAAYAPASVKALESDLKYWHEWCNSNGLESWPISVNNLITWLNQIDCAVATIRRKCASFRLIVRASNGYKNDPTREETFRLAFKAACRKNAGPQKQATPWTWNSTQTEKKKKINDDQSPLVRIRDQAFISLAYDTLARSSEMSNLELKDLKINTDSTAAILFRKTKTDQQQKGTWKYVSITTVILITQWLTRANIKEGPLFQGLLNGITPTGQKISKMGIWRLYQRMSERIDAPIDSNFSAHSTRVGAAVDMVSVGLDLPAIMQAGSWKSPEMVARYTASLATQRGASAQLAKLQQRS